MLPNEVEDRQELETILGSPLPELDPIYVEGAKVWLDRGDKHQLTTYYFLRELFTPEEMKMVIELPGTAKDVAEKTGLPEEYVAVKLKGLFRKGRIMPGKKYHMETSDTYVRIPDRVTLTDYITMAFFRERRDLSEEKNLFLLANKWGIKGWASQEGSNPLGAGSRIIPKWGAIKDIPGIMYSENMKEIFEENFKAGTMGWQKCVCRARKTLEDTGKSILPEGVHCETGVTEFDQKDGHCLWWTGQRSKYMQEQFDIHICTDHDELIKHFNECEDTVSIYSTSNRRGVGNCCVCCGDCCGIYKAYKSGIDNYVETRFKPEVNEDKCVGCKICQSRCLFDAITYNADGKCVVNPDKCKGCGNCVIKCPTKALKMKVVHEAEWIPDIGDYV